ncbi:cytochrome c biogenesis protein CcdA [archaeon]|nr:cytochrome c biogenesis protein CcdA [archaeon]
MTTAFGEEIEGVPTTFVDNKIIVGFSSSMSDSIEEEVKKCLEFGCDDPIDKIKDNETVKMIGDKTTAFEKLTIPAVISAAAVDAINPCAFAVLIILVSTILISKDRKKALLAGLAFSLSIFISYFLMGVGLYSAIQASGLTHNFYLVVAILAIFIGLFNLKDYLWYGKLFVMEVPRSWRPKMKSLIGGITSVPGAFAIGFVISLFLLPCTSGPYIVILGLLAKATTRSYAMLLLVLYNLIFILPMILITLAIFFGLTTTEKAEKFRQGKLKILHLIAGIIILCLGVGMLIALKLGMI